MKNILITGGAGFIGSNLAIQLISEGYHITVLDNLSPQIHGKDPEKTSPLYQSIKNKVNFIHGSVTNINDWKKAINNQDVIIHLAAETGTGQSMYEIKKYVETNIGGTALMLELLANEKHSIKQVLVAESRAIYGEGRYWSNKEKKYVYPKLRRPIDLDNKDFNVKSDSYDENLTVVSTPENSTIHPTSIYGITKQVQGQLVHLVCQSLGIKSVSFRYQNVYGPGQSLSNPYTGILSIFSTRIKNHNPINIFEDGLESRDFVYIDDVVNATILGLKKNEANGLAFNIGTGIPTTVLSVAKTLIDKYNIEVPIHISGEYRLGDIRHNFADISLAKKVLGFTPKWDFDKGITKFVEWVNLQNIQEDLYEKSIHELKEKGLFK